MKGHTDSVQDIAFDHTGKWLGECRIDRQLRRLCDLCQLLVTNTLDI